MLHVVEATEERDEETVATVVQQKDLSGTTCLFLLMHHCLISEPQNSS